MEIYFLISFAVFFVFGFYVGRKRKAIKPNVVENCSHTYAQGLNYLLANESDKAIQLFVDLIKVDGETAETHLALGKLFRSKGEVDKAIKIHLNILAKPSLDVEQRVQVLFELASDYQKAGLLDRSENVFKELLELDAKNIAALEHLQNMYIAEKSWLEAIHYAEALIKLKINSSRVILMHCYCELAESKTLINDFHAAKQYLQLAIDAQSKSTRPYIIKFKIETKLLDIKQGTKTLAILMNQHVSFIDLFVDDVYMFYKAQDSLDEYSQLLVKYNSNFTNQVMNLYLLKFYFQSGLLEEGSDLLDKVIDHQPNFDIYEMILIHLSYDKFDNYKYEQLLNFIKKHNRSKTKYHCVSCGYNAHKMSWQCPSCHSWSALELVKESS